MVTGVMKVLVSIPFVFFTFIFKGFKLKATDIRRAGGTFKSVLSNDLAKILDKESLGGNTSPWYYKALSAVTLILAAFDIFYYIISFSENLPRPFDFVDLASGGFTYRMDDDGTRHNLSQLCQAQKAGFILTTGMLMWFGYAFLFAFTWRVKSWYNQEQMRSYNARIEAQIEESLKSKKTGVEEDDLQLLKPPKWASSNKKWHDWIESSDLATRSLEKLLHDSIIEEKDENQEEVRAHARGECTGQGLINRIKVRPNEVAVTATKHAIYGKLVEHDAAELLLVKYMENSDKDFAYRASRLIQFALTSDPPRIKRKQVEDLICRKGLNMPREEVQIIENLLDNPKKMEWDGNLIAATSAVCIEAGRITPVASVQVDDFELEFEHDDEFHECIRTGSILGEMELDQNALEQEIFSNQH
jgi:hypothetical protein